MTATRCATLVHGVVRTTLFLLATAAAPLAAQDDDATQRRPWVSGVTIGVPGYERDAEPNLFLVGLHSTRVQSGHPGVDVYVGVSPRALVEGVIAIGARGGLVLPLAVSDDVVILPAGGATFIGGGSKDGAGALVGGNAGIGAIVRRGTQIGFRAGMSWHRFAGADDTFWLLEFGFVRPQS
jgi:hypothetical protein